MYRECCCNDEHDLALAEARGQFHHVTIRATITAEVTIPGRLHETADLEEYLDEVRENGEITDWEEV